MLTSRKRGERAHFCNVIVTPFFSHLPKQNMSSASPRRHRCEKKYFTIDNALTK